ncbi:MAG TPA: hypothetical protein VIU12_30035 [Chryseolinea sp.]
MKDRNRYTNARFELGWTTAGRLPIIVPVQRPGNVMKNFMERETVPLFAKREKRTASNGRPDLLAKSNLEFIPLYKFNPRSPSLSDLEWF